MFPIPANAKRIRYLESTGTQYIDTGVILTDQSEVRFRVRAEQTSGRYGLFGSRSGASSANVSGWINAGLAGLDFNNGSYATYRVQTSVSAGDIITASASATKRSVSVSGVATTNENVWSGSFATPSNCLICSINGSGWTLARVRIFTFQIYEAGVLVRDFVPLRIGTVGYLFDRVSGTLFGNAGTGDFVLGPDTFSQGVVPTRMMVGGVRKREPNTWDYVQTGLIGMWDGIENAGRGVHDANAATWKDLVGEHDFAVVLSDSEWEADAFYAKNRNAATSGFMNFSSSMTLQFVIKDNLSPATNTGNSAFVILGAHDGRYFGLLHRPSNNAYMADRAYYSQSISAGYKCLSFSNISQTVASMWADGSILSSSGYNSLDVTNARGNVARIGGTAEANRAIKLHCIRIYNRVLTDAEIAANYAIDRRRFNLP